MSAHTFEVEDRVTQSGLKGTVVAVTRNGDPIISWDYAPGVPKETYRMSVQHAVETPTIVQVVADVCTDLEPGSYFAVSVTDDDQATVAGVYDARVKAQRRASTLSGDQHGQWIRCVVAARTSDGAVAVMSGPLVLGIATPEDTPKR